MAKRYKQEYEIDYIEVFAPISRHVVFAVLNPWSIFQLDIKSAFLHGYLDKQVFVEQSPGYV